jgi:hypothetical protein
MLLVAGCGAAGKEKPVVGVVDDAARSGDATGFISELSESGFNALAVSSIWDPGEIAPDATETAALREVAAAAEAAGVRLFVIVYNAGSATTPITADAQSQFGAYAASVAEQLPTVRDLIIGNEPNLNRFWLPQFGSEGEIVSAAAYLSLLATTYDAVKAARDDVRIWGGATAPRGSDRPAAARATTSPTAFIQAIDLRHPRVKTIGLADYDKLVRLLATAFDGTAQDGSDLRILYGEIGVETAIPATKRAVYSGDEITATASEQQQAAAYRRTLELAACQPNVAGVLFFHLRDEPALTGWQSGVRYGDGTPKQSLRPVRTAAEEAEAGELGSDCSG